MKIDGIKINYSENWKRTKCIQNKELRSQKIALNLKRFSNN